MGATIDDDDLIKWLLDSALEVIAETPKIGVDNASEWATAGRLAIRMARKPQLLKLESQGIFVDLEYEDMSAAESGMKVPDGGRCDLILHRRGAIEDNLIACEIKMGRGKPVGVKAGDDLKLRAMTLKCRWQIGIWIQFPRSPTNKNAKWYAIYKNGQQVRQLQRY